MNHTHNSNGGINNYNILFCTNNNQHESPVRDYHQPIFKREEDHQLYKDYYGVSNFKFPEVTTNVFRTNHANFCELSFDGTKSRKHHHRRNNTIKRVASATTINCTAVKQEPFVNQEKSPGEEDKNKDTITFHYLAEQFKKKLKFIETPVKLHKNNATKQNKSTFDVILSPKPPTSYSSIETMSNILQSSDHMHKQIILTSKTFHTPPNKPDMHDREIQTAIIGIRNLNNMDECFNMSLASVNDIFYNMDLLPPNEDLFNMKRKKRKKLNLTMTHLPCVEIKCSSILFEMPVTNSHRPQMPRRTINTSTNNNSIIEDYHEVRNIEENISEPISVTVNNSETTDNLKDKIFNLFNDTQIAASEDFPKKVNDLCALIGSLLSESNRSKPDKKIKKLVKIPSEMFINIKKLKAGDSSRHNTLIIPSYSSSKKYRKNNMYEKSSSNPSTPQNRSRSVSPPSRPSTPSCQISKIPLAKSNNEMDETSARSESNESKLGKKNFDSSINTSFVMQNHSKFSFTSIPSVSTMSSGSRNVKMVFDEETDEKHTSQLGKPVPRNVFLIPPHVNEILKRAEYNTASNLRKDFGECKTLAANKDTKPTEFHLVNILKKPPVKQSWVVPDFVSKSQPKCDSVNNFECTKNTKTQKRVDYNAGGPSVTFSSMVDVFGGDNESLDKRICSRPDPKILKNTLVPVTGLKKSKTYPNKPELYAMNNDKEETNDQNCGLFTVRQTENKPKQTFEKQASFYNSNFLTVKKETNTISCLQKRKDYDNKLKMQLQLQHKHASKIPLPTRVAEQQNNEVKNETSKATASKLPLKIRNEVINNKQVNFRSNVQEFSKLFTTDIKDTPFSKLISENTPKKQESLLNTPRPTNSSLKNTPKNIETNFNVTKDVTQ